MKRIFLAAIGLLFFQIALGQVPDQPVSQSIERSKSNLPVISEVRSILESATGWMLQDDGQWISARNEIPFKDAEFNQSSKAQYKLGKENFKTLQLRDVVVNNETYTILIIFYKTGWYEFPILLKGWHKQEGLSFFVFKKSKLLEILPDSVEYNKPTIINLEVVCQGILLDFDKKDFTSTIAYNIQKTFIDKTIAAHNLLIAVMPVQLSGQTFERFRLINVINRKKFYLPYLDVKDRDKLLRNSYYETDFETFRNFIRYDTPPAKEAFR